MRVAELARSAGFNNVEVINLGVASYGTLQEYMVFRDIGKLYKPDLVLLSFFVANDVVNNSMELESMQGPERPHRLARPFLDPNESLQWTIIPGDFEWAQRRYAEEQAYLDAQRNRLTERLLFLRLGRAELKRLLKLGFQNNEENKPTMAQRERQDLAVFGVNFCTESAEYTAAWNTTERILAKLKEDVEAVGGKLVVFTVPALEEVSVEYMNRATASTAHPEKLCFEEAPGHACLSLILRKLDIELVTLLPVFRRAMREDNIQLYYTSDQHWNPEGHALAAKLVVSELIKRGLLPTPGEPVPSKR